MGRRHLFALLCGVAVLLLSTSALAKPKHHPKHPHGDGTRTETPVASASPDANRVAESYVSLYVPLPASAGDHPAACDWIHYLRFRNVHGPTNPSKAAAVFVGMPGIFAGAASFDQLARHAVLRAAKRHRFVEFWALDRRSNCLEDHTGVDAAARAGDPTVAYNYYWNGGEADGKHFGGFKTPQEAAVLQHVGLEQTMRDEYAVITRGIPDPQVRRRKVFCGGHSLGGPLTAAFADWDFDGNPQTTDDAGYSQCAGFFGLDTSLTLDISGKSGGQAGPSELGAAGALTQASAGSPYVNAPPFTAETIEIVGIFGVGAFDQPNGTTLISGLPHSQNIDLSTKVLFSKDAVNFLTGTPSIRDFNITNEAVLGGLFDDNSEPITILRASLGTVTGGPVAQKDFPTPGDANLGLPLVDNAFLEIPSEPNGPLYRWWNYNQMNDPGTPQQVNNAGQPYTSAKSEVSDLHQLARGLFEAPADYTEQYFPTRLLTDLEAAANGDRSNGLEQIAHDGIAKRPAFLIEAGDSSRNSGADPQPGQVEAPNALPLSGGVSLPGYNHIDVVGAAWRKGRGPAAEPSSLNLVGFMFRTRGLRPHRGKHKHHKHAHHTGR